MTPGDVALAVLPQADGEGKARPVLLVGQLPGYGDWLVLGISSQIAKALEDWDVTIDPTTQEFSDTGLKTTSIVRLRFIATIPSSRIRGVIGALPGRSFDSITRRLSDFITAGRGSSA
jgi:mRNA interferase MazF